jgi:WXXGXW repeat (2 copies)
MRNLRAFVRNAAIVAALSAALSACVVYPYPPAHAYYVGGPVAMAPPPPVVETYGVAPTPGYVWIGGYWNWVGGQHVWVGGHWDAPRPGYRWEPHHWVHAGDGWHLAGGRWVRH